MTQIDDDVRIRGLLEKRDFEHLSVEDWCLVFKSIIREDDEEKASYERRTLGPAFAALPSLKLSYVFHRQDREGTFQGAVLGFLKEALPASARPLLSQGLDQLVHECMEHLKNSPESREAVETILLEAVKFENWFGPIINGALAEEIALDRTLPVEIRLMIVQNLMERSFPLSVSKGCWRQLRIEVPQIPRFAAAVMEHLLDDYDSDGAFNLPLKFRPDDDDPWTMSELAGILGKVLERASGDTDNLKRVLRLYPEWAINLIREDVLPGLTGRPAEAVTAALP